MEPRKEHLNPQWNLYGEGFSPAALQQMFPSLVVSRAREKEEIANRGPRKGMPWGKGSCTVLVKLTVENKLEWLLDFILEHGEAVRKLGVER